MTRKQGRKRHATPLDSIDEKQALEQYRKIRLGSLRGARMTQALIEFAKQTLGPDWERKITGMVHDREDREEQQTHEH